MLEEEGKTKGTFKKQELFIPQKHAKWQKERRIWL